MASPVSSSSVAVPSGSSPSRCLPSTSSATPLRIWSLRRRSSPSSRLRGRRRVPLRRVRLVPGRWLLRPWRPQLRCMWSTLGNRRRGGAGRDLRAPPRLLPRLLPWVGRRGRRRRAAAGRPASFLVVALGPRPGVRLALRRDVVLARVPSVVLLEMASSLCRLLVVRTVTPLTPRFLIPSSPASRVIALAISSLGARTLLSVSSVGRMDT